MSTVKVKVKVSVLIAHLEKALAEREARFKNQAKEQEKYEKAVEAYNLAVLKLIKAGKGKLSDACHNSYYDRANKKNEVQFSVTVLFPKSLLPKEPERPDTYHEHTFRCESEEIKQAIRVLNLTEDSLVSASTYNSVAKYL